MDDVHIVIDNEGNIVGVFLNEEDAEECSEDYEYPSSVYREQVQEHYNP